MRSTTRPADPRRCSGARSPSPDQCGQPALRDQPRAVRSGAQRSRGGADPFTPGWTSYGKRLQYQTYDVTGLLAAGGNAIGATLGDGWYRGHLGFNDSQNLYGRRVALLLQLAAAGVRTARQRGRDLVLEVGSGHYAFRVAR